MFNDNFTKIYVVCPANYASGGPELLHQLVYVLDQFNRKGIIAYTNAEDNYQIRKEYQQYVHDFTRFNEIDDREENIVVITEVQIELFEKIKKARVLIWWLSVDNYLKAYNPIYAYRLLGLKGLCWYIKHRRWRYRRNRIRKLIRYNLAQSQYAIDFLTSNDFQNVDFLSDYINQSYLTEKIEDDVRNDVVLYNPRKGINYTTKLMKYDGSIEWVPIINLNQKEVKELLCKSKVYVDFGNHPGKDRLPREAAACGCCVIVGMNGSAKNHIDVPIPNKYKFACKKGNEKEIIRCIKTCINEYNDCKKDFAMYRKTIGDEYMTFCADVKRVFLE